MLRIYSCIQADHDLRLVALAGMICVTASLAAVVLLRHAQAQRGPARLRWTGGAGLASGFGIWATHFVAVMGYDPGVVAGYAIGITFVSLIVAVASTTCGFLLALHSRRLPARGAAGALVGGGVAAMHYLGMQAIELPGHFIWSMPYVLGSISFAIVPMVAALNLALDRPGLRSALGAGMLIVVAILLLHFTGMAAITLIPDGGQTDMRGLLSPLAMATVVAATAFVMLAIGVISAILSRRANVAIAASEREFRILVQGISDCAIYMLNPEGRVASWNAGAHRLKGYPAAEAIGLELARFYAPEERDAGLPALGLETARREGKFTGEGWRYRKNGSRFWAHVLIETVYDEDGAFKGFAKVTRDMTRFKEDQDRLSALTYNLDTALSSMHQGLSLYGPDERLIVSNDRVYSIFNISREKCPPGTLYADIMRMALESRAGGPVSDDVIDEALARHRECIARPEGGTLIVPFTPDCILSIAHSRTRDGGWVSTMEDVTEQRRAEQRIAHMAMHDALTGLPNRLSYHERLDAAIDEAERTGALVAVVGLDLDRFKEVNDTHGHSVGDAVLGALAARLRDHLAQDECVARLGGDEFAAFKCYAGEDELRDFVARIETALAAPIDVDGLVVVPGASLGIALYPADGETREQLVNNADLAMYRAKSEIGPRTCYYEQGMDEAARARRVLANDLREAIPRGELSLAYQVQRSVSTQEIVGYEALLRWRHPRDGWISPTEFIPIAEESGAIIQLGAWVLRTACAEAARWPEPWRVAINLSAIQLMDVGLVATVTDALVRAGLPAKRLELEVTETALVVDKVRAMHVLRQIKAMGVSIAIDDFGTGYSSLDTLNSFPFDKIKIDKSFLLDSDESPQARAIVRAVLALGRSLSIPVLAEGLENEQQLKLLADEGCDQAQGYLWGRPTQYPTAGGPDVSRAA